MLPCWYEQEIYAPGEGLGNPRYPGGDEKIFPAASAPHFEKIRMFCRGWMRSPGVKCGHLTQRLHGPV